MHLVGGAFPLVCQMMTFYLGDTAVRYALKPKGTCDYCCPVNERKDFAVKLYTRENPVFHDLIIVGDRRRLLKSRLNFSRDTVLFLHGFTEMAPGSSGKAIRDAYLKRGNYNVILVDWGSLVGFPWYVEAVSNTRLCGNFLARFIEFLFASGVKRSKLHVIGFSLGAEAAGFAGKNLKAKGIMLKRITGLDPAYPGYSFGNPDEHLSSGDAEFVDVIHTNAGLFGYPTPIGDVDFYPNPGNIIQPGCDPFSVLKDHRFGQLFSCSHQRAWRYYVESILNERGFPATSCMRDDRTCWSRAWNHQKNYMGMSASPKVRGRLFLYTNEKPPFSMYARRRAGR